jgi:hypothetical protein
MALLDTHLLDTHLLDTRTWSGLIFSGGWREAAGGDAPVVEPATGEELERIGSATPADRIVHINDQTVGDEAVAPFGGVGESGTGSRLGGLGNLAAFTDTQWLTIAGEVPPYPF